MHCSGLCVAEAGYSLAGHSAVTHDTAATLWRAAPWCQVQAAYSRAATQATQSAEAGSVSQQFLLTMNG